MSFEILSVPVFVAIAGFVIFPLWIQLARRFNILDKPCSRKQHGVRTPVVGGLGIVSLMLFGFVLCAVLDFKWLSSNFSGLVPIGFAVILLLSFGLMDDLKRLPVSMKLLAQVLAIYVIFKYDPTINQLGNSWSAETNSFVWLVMGLWVLAVINSINFVDGIDGLAGGMVLIIGGALAVMGTHFLPMGHSSLLVGFFVLAAIIPFLFFNWNPAKVFLGDNGSFVLGFILAYLSLAVLPAKPDFLHLMALPMIFAYPLFDMALVIAKRIKNSRPTYEADRAHLHYRLCRVGFSVRQASSLILLLVAFSQLAVLALLNIELISVVSLSVLSIALTFSLFAFMVIHNERNQLLWGVKKELSDIIPMSFYDTSPRDFVVDLKPLFSEGILDGPQGIPKLISGLRSAMNNGLEEADKVFLHGDKLLIRMNANNEQKEEDLEEAIQNCLSTFESSVGYFSKGRLRLISNHSSSEARPTYV